MGPKWERSPNEVKNVLDRIFCKGVNRITWHTFDSSPDETGLPGVSFFAGTHLNRKVTWWEESKYFIDYINRTQHMLSQGLHVADVIGDAQLPPAERKTGTPGERVERVGYLDNLDDDRLRAAGPIGPVQIKFSTLTPGGYSP